MDHLRGIIKLWIKSSGTVESLLNFYCIFGWHAKYLMYCSIYCYSHCSVIASPWLKSYETWIIVIRKYIFLFLNLVRVFSFLLWHTMRTMLKRLNNKLIAAETISLVCYLIQISFDELGISLSPIWSISVITKCTFQKRVAADVVAKLNFTQQIL